MHENGMERKRNGRSLARERTVQQSTAMGETRLVIRKRRMLVSVRTLQNDDANKT